MATPKITHGTSTIRSLEVTAAPSDCGGHPGSIRRRRNALQVKLAWRPYGEPSLPSSCGMRGMEGRPSRDVAARERVPEPVIGGMADAWTTCDLHRLGRRSSWRPARLT